MRGRRRGPDKLRSCVVDENVGLPDTAVLVYEDGDRELLGATSITIGSPLKVFVAAAAQSNARELLFSGEVTALEMDVDSTGSYTVIRAMSKAHRLFRGRRVKAFRKMTASTVVRQVAKNAGLTVGRVETSRITYQHISQAGVSDWDFLQMLAREHGAVVGVDDRGRLEFTKLKPAAGAPAPTSSAKTNPHVLEFGENLMVLRAALTSAELANGVEVRGWDVDQANRSWWRCATTPRARPSSPACPRPRRARRSAPRPGRWWWTRPTARRRRRKRPRMRWRSRSARASASWRPSSRATRSCVRACPSRSANVGAAFAGRYTATAVTHVLEPDAGYRTTVLVSASHDRSLAGLATGGAPVRDVRMPGLATGIVTDIKEVGGGQRGWVRLKFPWLDDDYVTDWVRTVQLGGVGGGGVFSPDVNDEVLVGFEQGSLDRPYVLGGLYNGVDKPSPHAVPLVDRTSGKVNRRSLVSRKGNRLELLDGTTASGVRLASGDKQLEVLLDERKKSLELNVRKKGGRQVTSSIKLDRTGITLDAKRGVVQIKGRVIRLN